MIFFLAVQILNFLQLSSPCEISLVYLIYIDCTSILDSLVVRISACHVEGPGSIPGRGGNFLEAKMARIVYLNI